MFNWHRTFSAGSSCWLLFTKHVTCSRYAGRVALIWLQVFCNPKLLQPVNIFFFVVLNASVVTDVLADVVLLYNKVAILGDTMKETPCIKFVVDLKSCLATLILTRFGQRLPPLYVPSGWYLFYHKTAVRKKKLAPTNKQTNKLTN
jgi:hypothetical protein